MDKAYVLSIFTIKVGDVIEDDIGKIKVTKIFYYSSPLVDSLPKCKYYGRVLTKKGEPFKRENMRYIYQENVRG